MAASHSGSPLLFALMMLAALLLLFAGAYVTWRSYRGGTSERLDRRLGRPPVHDASVLLRRAPEGLMLFDGLLARWQKRAHLDLWLLQSGVRWSAPRLAVTCLGAAVCACLLAQTVLTLPLWQALALALVAGLIPAGSVARKRTVRLALLERQLPEALDLLVRALRAGHAFSSSLQMAGSEMSDPIASELRLTHEEVSFGAPLDQALLNLEQRVPLMDLRYFVVAVLVQREAGGNLTELLANLSKLVRERLKLVARVRVLTAEGRLSAWFIALLPFFLFAVIFTVNRKFMEPLWLDPMGITLVRNMLGMMLVGVLWLRRITHVRV
jgi:tight adherence protein B